MAAKYIVAAVSVVFLITAIVRVTRDSGRIGPATRTWLIIAFIFGVVSLWLWGGAG